MKRLPRGKIERASSTSPSVTTAARAPAAATSKESRCHCRHCIALLSAVYCCVVGAASCCIAVQLPAYSFESAHSPSQGRACCSPADLELHTPTRLHPPLPHLQHLSPHLRRLAFRDGQGIGETRAWEQETHRDMATPTQPQPYGSGSYPTPASQSGGGPAAQQQPVYTPSERPPTAAQAQFQQQQQQQQAASNPPFEKYCIIHIATTCDEHGVYVTKDSAEVIEIGWVVVDAQNPEREVRVGDGRSSVRCLHCETRHGKNRPAWARMLIKRHCSCTASPCSSALSTLPSRRCALRSPL